jgi:hypothetical protein
MFGHGSRHTQKSRSTNQHWHTTPQQQHPHSYECDWCYALGLEPESTPTTLDLFLDSIGSGQYNQVVVNFYANHSNRD